MRVINYEKFYDAYFASFGSRKATPVSTEGSYQARVHGRRMSGVNRFPIFQYLRRPVCFLIEVFLLREALYFQNEAPTARSRVGGEYWKIENSLTREEEDK